MKIRYAIRRVINTNNYENIAIEFEAEASDEETTEEALIEYVENFIEQKELEIRSQLNE